MMGIQGPLMPLFALVWPLFLGMLALVPGVRDRALRLLVLAPLPALVHVATGVLGETTQVPWLLLGVTLSAGRAAMLLLGLTAALWLATAIYAQAYLAKSKNQPTFTAFWCLTFAGNIGVFLAADVASFYLAFAAVSLAAYFLVIHDRTATAMRAGRVYIMLAILGETSLLLGFLIGADAADSFLIADIRPALLTAPQGNFAIGFLVLGFGLKAGLMPLHVWLPLAHPAAPVPASAVLSGAIVKAGIIGLIVFLPVGAFSWGTTLIVAGLVGAYAGVALGLTQTNPKTILAYSTISQMGLIVAAVGATIIGTLGAEAVAFQAFHHGLAKGALFLSVGLLAACGRGYFWPVLVMTGLVAASIAGLPLNGGALAKAAVKPGFEGYALTALAVSGFGSALLMARFLWVVASQGQTSRTAPPALMLLPWLALAVGALVGPWLLWPVWIGQDYGKLLVADTLWQAAWPALAGFVVAIAAAVFRLRRPKIPEGDIVIWLEPLAARFAVVMMQLRGPTWAMGGGARTARLLARLATIESGLLRWQIAGLAVLLLALLVAA